MAVLRHKPRGGIELQCSAGILATLTISARTISRQSRLAEAESGHVSGLAGIACMLNTRVCACGCETPRKRHECVGSINHVAYFLVSRVKF